MDDLEAFRLALARLVTKPCWSVGTGGATGSHFDLDFGERVPRVPPLKNPRVSDEVRYFKGEFGLYVYGAPWRVQTREEVVGSWRDPGPSDGPMGWALKRLVGKRVTGVAVEPPALDLTLDFEDDLRLCVFSDGTERMDDTDFTLFIPGANFAVGMGGRILRESDSDAGEN